jgi:glucokinase
MIRLVADAGGTNVRFALAREDGRLEAVRSYRVDQFSSLEAALSAYRSDTGCKGVHAAAIAAAGPTDGNTLKVTNSPWLIERSAIATAMGGVPVGLVNDLEAVAAALPHLTGDDFDAFAGPRPVRPESRTMLAVNVGTGFGAASIIRHGESWWTCPSEAGHMTLGRASAEEFELMPDDRSIEDVLSGHGLTRLYARLGGDPARAGDSAAVLARAARDPEAARAAGLFGTVLGRTAGDLALANCAWGGVYLCGSVVLGWAALADTARFWAEFTRKGPMLPRMQAIPVAAIRRPDVSLFGLAKIPAARLMDANLLRNKTLI